ncbi:MAG TPA: NAD(P)H-hydrate dehydratase [Gaiellaceae bacterium]|nr:NAD(P)H-hydrate dehydratase [Gaiellaceae bacterium]
MWTEPLYTAAEMRAAEAAYEGTTLELMERAGAAAAAAALRRFPDAKRFTVWCGTGANGGDGFVVARILHEAGRAVEVVLADAEAKVQGDARENLDRIKELGIRLAETGRSADVVVDALFGTGFRGAPRADAVRHIEEINSLRAPVLSLDVPSGVDASTGEVAGPAVEAEVTITFHGPKVGLAVAPGRFRVGEVEVADIGLAAGATRHGRVTEEILAVVPRRKPTDNKYTAGSVLVVGGSAGYTGAPSLTAEAAMRAGAGIVTVCVPEPSSLVFEVRLVEAMSRPCPADDEGRMTAAAADTIMEAAKRAGAVAIGPGLGRSEGTHELVRILLDRLDLPVVLDADGLWALAGHLEWVFSRDAGTVLTPHAGELGGLLGRTSDWVASHRLDAVQGGADDVGATVLLKGADTLVAAPGRGVLVCDLGNPGLATAGTGDVLTGIVAAFLAKGMKPTEAAAAAAVAGGVAAGLAAQSHGTAGMLARDVIGALSPALSK